MMKLKYLIIIFKTISYILKFINNTNVAVETTRRTIEVIIIHLLFQTTKIYP